jgi:hypothetical protein
MTMQHPWHKKNPSDASGGASRLFWVVLRNAAN